MSLFHCQPVLERKHVFNWSMLLTAFVVRIPVGPWHLHLTSDTAQNTSHMPGPLGDAPLTDEASVCKAAIGLGMPQRPHTAQSFSVGSWSQREGEDPFLKQKETPPENRANDALIQRTPSKVFTEYSTFTPLSAALASQELNHREWPLRGVPCS